MAINQKIRKAIEKRMAKLPKDFVVAVISKSEKYAEVNMAIVDYLTKKRKMPGVYITMNKPYKSLRRELERNKIDTSKLFFVDAISGMIGERESRDKNCVLLQSPASLTELGMIISNVCQSKKPKFIMMDSLSIMLMYNNQDTTARFVHYITTQLRKHAWPGIIFSLEKDMKGNILQTVTHFCDKVIRV